MSELVSVLVSAFNSEKYIEEAIKSITNQTYKNLEILVIDDGSTDSTLSILNNLKQTDSRITILSQDNTGICKATNKLLSLAKGEFISIMDSDDIMLPTKIEKQLAYLKKHQDVDVLGTGYSIIDGAGNIKKRVQPRKLRSYPMNIILLVWYCYPSHHPTIMFRSKLLERFKNPYRPIPSFKNAPPKLKKGQMADTYLFFRLILNKVKFDNLSESLFLYRVNVEGSLSSHSKNETKLYVLNYLTKLLSRYLTHKSNYFQENTFTLITSYGLIQNKPSVFTYAKYMLAILNIYNKKFNSIKIIDNIKLSLFLIKQVLKYTMKHIF